MCLHLTRLHLVTPQTRTRLSRGLSVATVAAVLAVAATGDAEAQRRSGYGMSGMNKMSLGARPMTMQRAPSTFINKSTMVGGKYGTIGVKPGSKAAVVYPPGGIKVPPGRTPPPKGPVVGEKPPEKGPGRPPRPPRRPPYGPIGPIVGPVIGPGVVIGPAVAAPVVPPPSPPPVMMSSPGPTGPTGPRTNVAIDIPPQNENRFVPNEVVLELPGNFSANAMQALTRRHRLVRLESIGLQSTGTTFLRARITDGRSVRAVLASLRSETTLRAGQPNYIFTAAEQSQVEPSQAAPAQVQIQPADAPKAEQGATFTPPAPATPAATPVAAAAGALPALGGDPAQYALTKLRLQEAHSLTKGRNVLVAVIDSGIDAGHPELRGVIAGTFDALGKAEKPHSHGTAMAGTIAARSRLMGVAPAARILAIRAFGASATSAQATSFAILKGLEHAMAQNARVINMSFAGPHDPGLSRSLAQARSRGIVLVAAAGNLGEKAPPQYPAADQNVIAVTATDANDKLFRGSVRGQHIAVAAPGVDILVPTPNANYDVTTGTSVAAAHVSGVVALILERKPDLDPESVRKILLTTARDLGSIGPDPEYGAGLADAYQALITLEQRKLAGPEQLPTSESATTAQ